MSVEMHNFKIRKVLASSQRNNHAAALFGADGKNYLFKDSGPSKINYSLAIYFQLC